MKVENTLLNSYYRIVYVVDSQVEGAVHRKSVVDFSVLELCPIVCIVSVSQK